MPRGIFIKEASHAYGVDYANTLVMCVDLIDQPLENLKEAKDVLQNFKGNLKADNLLLTIERLEGK